uniref:Uncharacterized protein n=1 Tax=Parascaris equorum TaxID=6256 RepID=A0A914RIR8_PAREQ
MICKAIYQHQKKRFPRKTRTRDDIQCLRELAIIYGFLGVDIFFVISGYLIAMILSKNTPISLANLECFFQNAFVVYFSPIGR